MSDGYVVVAKDVNGEIVHFYIYWGPSKDEAIANTKARSHCDSAQIIKDLDLESLSKWKTALELIDGITFSSGGIVEVTAWANTQY